MVQTVQHGRGDEGTRGKRITLPIVFRYLLFDALMRSSLVVIGNILPHQTMQLVAMENEHIVQAFSFQTANEAFTDGIGPRRSFGGLDGFDAGGLEQG